MCLAYINYRSMQNYTIKRLNIPDAKYEEIC